MVTLVDGQMEYERYMSILYPVLLLQGNWYSHNNPFQILWYTHFTDGKEKNKKKRVRHTHTHTNQWTLGIYWHDFPNKVCNKDCKKCSKWNTICEAHPCLTFMTGTDSPVNMDSSTIQGPLNNSMSHGTIFSSCERTTRNELCKWLL